MLPDASSCALSGLAVMPHELTDNTAIIMRAKSGERALELSPLSSRLSMRMTPADFSYNAAISAREYGSERIWTISSAPRPSFQLSAFWYW